ncbi:MAG: hypothetical protein V7K67_22105 [Nostoc sp.]|uniref:hypothetical protein n=1 Tax=Nostoc sp. TaxID=1180 RepID=UPI002FF9570D
MIKQSNKIIGDFSNTSLQNPPAVDISRRRFRRHPTIHPRPVEGRGIPPNLLKVSFQLDRCVQCQAIALVTTKPRSPLRITSMVNFFKKPAFS